jgi:hypothetical protein
MTAHERLRLKGPGIALSLRVPDNAPATYDHALVQTLDGRACARYFAAIDDGLLVAGEAEVDLTLRQVLWLLAQGRALDNAIEGT